HFVSQRSHFTARAATAGVACALRGVVRIGCDQWPAFPVVSLLRVEPTGLSVIARRRPIVWLDWCTRDRDARFGRVELLDHAAHLIILKPLPAETADAVRMISRFRNYSSRAIEDLKRMSFVGEIVHGAKSFDIVRAIHVECVGVVDEI